jgi:4-alpha-glucanotransferase
MNNRMILNRRSSGILLHITSLPSHWGIGDLGPGAYDFLDWLEAAGQEIWQILPLGPTGEGDSPYGATSTFAGNPLLISPDSLLEDGLLPPSGLPESSKCPTDRVDYAEVIARKSNIFRKSWNYLRQAGRDDVLSEIDQFIDSAQNSNWLADWTLFAALKEKFDHQAWTTWLHPIKSREGAAVTAAREQFYDEIRYQAYLQYLFSKQWNRLKQAAARRGIRFLGDLPIFVANDSADVWANQHLFDLNDFGEPISVAGVPPDAFSPTGQLWGNPLYRWDRMQEDDYRWWTSRIQHSLDQVDLLRLDHFRGFAGFWKIPAEAPDASHGNWVEGPREALFEAIRTQLGDLPLIAEDLGVITPDVTELLEQLGIPGMRVLQFAFDEIDSIHLPHNYNSNLAVYTGTHDNPTLRSWFADLAGDVRHRVSEYLGGSRHDLPWAMIRAAWESVANLSITPVQDLLGLEMARMNTPGSPDGNWSWRLEEGELQPELAARLRGLTELTGRLRKPQESS